MWLFISGQEIVFIVFIVVLLFGADKIPELARAAGKGMRQLRDATEDIKREIKDSAELDDVNTDMVSDIKKEIDTIKDDITGPIKRNL